MSNLRDCWEMDVALGGKGVVAGVRRRTAEVGLLGMDEASGGKTWGQGRGCWHILLCLGLKYCD